MGRGYVCFQKPFSSLKQPKPRAECPSVIKVALNEAWHIQRDAGERGGGPEWRGWGGGRSQRGWDGTVLQPPMCRIPGLGRAGEKEEKSFCVSGQAGGKENTKKKKKTTRGWSARETFDFVFLAILFLGRRSSWGCWAEAMGRSQEHPQPTQGPKSSAQRPPGPRTARARIKARSSQEKLKSEMVGAARAGGTGGGTAAPAPLLGRAVGV